MSFAHNGVSKVKNLVGTKFNKLTVVEILGVGKFGKTYWRCFCDCGGWSDLTTQVVNSGGVLSCGCMSFDIGTVRHSPTKHGLYSHPVYKIHSSMKQRCKNPNSQRWEYYGGKGISVCDEWQDFMTFYNWAVNNGWLKGLSIERINSCGNYCPDNCEWITVAENTRRSNARKS